MPQQTWQESYPGALAEGFETGEENSMGVRLTSQENVVALFDSVTGQAFGEVFASEEEAESFLDWFQARHGDPRTFILSGDVSQYQKFLRYRQEWHRITHDQMTGEFAQEIADSLVRTARS